MSVSKHTPDTSVTISFWESSVDPKTKLAAIGQVCGSEWSFMWWCTEPKGHMKEQGAKQFQAPVPLSREQQAEMMAFKETVRHRDS